MALARAAAPWSSRAHSYSWSVLRQRRTPNLFLDKVDRRTLNSQIESASAVPGEERCTLHARCDFWCFSSLSTPCLSPSAPSGMGILKALPGYFSSVRSVACMGLAVYQAMHVLNFVYWLFFPCHGFASSSSSPIGSSRSTKRPLAPIEEPRRMAMEAPPRCARPFVLDRAVKEDVCRTSDAVPLCPCTVLCSRRSSRP